MRILLTNDDGVTAPGLAVMAQALLDAGHEVLVVGPDSERSGSGSSVGTIEHGASVGLQRLTLATSPALTAVALDAPPALAVLAAVSGVLGPRPDLVVSGVNPGNNLGVSILFSGTVGAALTGRMVGLPSLAVSCGFEPEARYDTAAALAVPVVERLDLMGLPPVALSLNAPDLDLADVAGCRVTALGTRSMFALRMEEGPGSLVLTRHPTAVPDEPGSDLEAILSGWASLTELTALEGLPEPETATAMAAMLDDLVGTVTREERRR